jgi:hypothetical protein
VDALHVDLYWTFPLEVETKFVPIRLAAAAAVNDLQCAVVASASFWRLGSGACQWSAAALASVSVVSRGRDDRSDP